MRADLHDRPDLCRPAGAASRNGAPGRPPEARADQGRRPGDQHDPHAGAGKAAPDPRPRPAHRREVCASSATTTRAIADLARAASAASCRGASRSHARPAHHQQDDRREGRRDRPADLQQPGAPQRGVARDVGGRDPDHRRFRARRRGPGHRRQRRRRPGLCLGRRHLRIQGEARLRGGGRRLQQDLRERAATPAGHAEADDRDDPRLLHRRRRRHGTGLRHADRRRGLALRHSGRQARARLWL